MARSNVNYIYDAATPFRAPGSAPVTATADYAVALDKMVNVRPGSQKNKLGAEGYKVVIVVNALDTADGDETYTFSVNAGVDPAHATVVAGGFAVVGTGQHVIELDAATIEALDADR